MSFFIHFLGSSSRLASPSTLHIELENMSFNVANASTPGISSSSVTPKCCRYAAVATPINLQRCVTFLMLSHRIYCICSQSSSSSLLLSAPPPSRQDDVPV